MKFSGLEAIGFDLQSPGNAIVGRWGWDCATHKGRNKRGGIREKVLFYAHSKTGLLLTMCDQVHSPSVPAYVGRQKIAVSSAAHVSCIQTEVRLTQQKQKAGGAMRGQLLGAQSEHNRYLACQTLTFSLRLLTIFPQRSGLYTSPSTWVGSFNVITANKIRMLWLISATTVSASFLEREHRSLRCQRSNSTVFISGGSIKSRLQKSIKKCLAGLWLCQIPHWKQETGH